MKRRTRPMPDREGAGSSPAPTPIEATASITLAAFPLQPDRAEDDDALENELEIRIHIVQPHDVVDDSDGQHADERAADRSDSARETRAADDNRGDRVELVRDAVIGIALLQIGRAHVRTP